MPEFIKMMHIDPAYQITYFVLGPGVSIRTKVPLEKAISLLQNEIFYLIVSEPPQRAVLNPQNRSIESEIVPDSEERLIRDYFTRTESQQLPA